MDFGIIITCSENDMHFARGCAESVRHYHPQTPICLMVDGKPRLDDFIRLYDPIVINRQTILNNDLREKSFGWGITKMIVFWESPFERFLLIDSDTCMWGSLSESVKKLDDFDIVIDETEQNRTDDQINQYFFDMAKVRTLYPDFESQGNPYYCTGVTLARKGIFELEDYMELLETKNRDPELFLYGEMGILNFLIFKMKAEGNLRVGRSKIQYVVPDFDQDKMLSLFKIEDLNRPVEERVIHWCGNAKPVVVNPHGHHTEPMTYFRQKHYSKLGYSSEDALFVMKKEDKQWERKRQVRYYKKRLQDLILKPFR